MEKAPSRPMTANHTSTMGPKTLPIFPVPKCWKQKRPSMMAM